MRKRLWLIMVLLICFSGCSRQESPELLETIPEDTSVSTTLMIYMIGSDLEAKASAGTADLEEIAASGVDLSSTNVLVYAGGTPYWHNDLVEEECNAILELASEGFVTVYTEPAVSMGESQTLTSFLNYCKENYSSDRYALILWNHGSGPVYGYGYDLAFEGGSLLLSEMEQAMKDSPFGADNKLCFVGFDACLMASAELCCIWDDYADYMVSSQEVEPSIGWDYSFVKNVASAEVTGMLVELTETYLSACESYYKDKGYDLRETTLSCVDLSRTVELEQAIDALFGCAADDVSLLYDKLAARRVETRAFGRASTGSEYDLVDLGNLAASLEDLYPEETAKLSKILLEMVISNSTNTESCSGLSIYYPFYNKDYFFKSIRGMDSWQTIYRNMGLFSEYQEYLEKYQQIWNSTDRLDNYASSLVPIEQNGKYCLQLTEEQQSCYASARYYILQRISPEIYKCLFMSSDVTNEDGLLVANYDGKIIYVQDKYGFRTIPHVIEEDHIGRLSYYSVPVWLMDYIPDSDPFGMFASGETVYENYRYQLVVDQEANQVSVSALLPENDEQAGLAGGKLEDADMSRWGCAFFMDLNQCYLSRDENGVILPFEQWNETGWYTGAIINFADSLTFAYEPLENGEYYLMMEIQDTQGNRYCSELQQVQVTGQVSPRYEYPETIVHWDNSDRVLLTEENGVSVYMICVEESGKIRFTLELENNNDFDANLVAADLICNRDIICEDGDGWGQIYTDPGQTARFEFMPDNLGVAEECGALETLNTISCKVYVRDEITGAMLVEPRIFHIELSEQLTEKFRTHSDRIGFTGAGYMGAKAETQELYNDGSVRIGTRGLGENENTFYQDIYCPVWVENLSEEVLTVSVEGAVVNDVFICFSSDRLDIPAGLTGYVNANGLTFSIEDSGITQIESISLLVRVTRSNYVFTGFSESFWCPIVLSERSENAEPFREAERVIFEKDGIRIALDPPESSSIGDTYWKVTVCNDSPYSIKADIIPVSVNGSTDTDSILCYISDAFAGPGQYGVGYLTCGLSLEDIQEFAFSIQIKDLFEEGILFTDEDVITLKWDESQ